MREPVSSKPRFQWIKYLLCLPCSLPTALLIASQPTEGAENAPSSNFLRCVLSEESLSHSVEGAREQSKEEEFGSSNLIPFVQTSPHRPATASAKAISTPFSYLSNPETATDHPKRIQTTPLRGAAEIALSQTPEPLVSLPLQKESPFSAEQRSVDASFTTSPLVDRDRTLISKPSLKEDLLALINSQPPVKQAAKNSPYPLYEQDPKAFFSGFKQIAQESAPQAPAAEISQGHLINFRNAPMGDYIRFVAGLTGRNFVYREEDVDFNVTVVSKEPTSLENVISALLQELRIHGLALIQQDNNFIIYPALGPLSPAALIPTEEGPTPEVGTRIFLIRHVGADSISEIVTRMLSDQAIVQVVKESNSLLITDFTTNIDRIAKIIKVIDSVSVVHDMGQYVATNHSIETLIPIAERILEPLSGGNPPTFVIQASTNSAFIIASTELITQAFAILDRLDGKTGTTGIFNYKDLLRLGEERNRQPEQTQTPVSPSGAGTEGGRPGAQTPEAGAGATATGTTLGGGIQAQGAEGQARGQPRLPEEALEFEGDVLTNTPEGGTVSRGTQWTPPETRTGGPPPGAPSPRKRTKFYIYKLDFRKGDQLVAALLSIAESLSYDEEQNRALLDAINSVQWIEASNSIIITGTYEAIIKVKDLIQELDIPLKQVYLEMLILDTSLSDSITFSVDTLDRVSTPDFGAAQGFFGSANQTQQPLTVINPNPTVSTLLDASPLASVQGFNMGIIGRHIFHNNSAFSSLAALVRALHSNTTIDVVLNPKIVVEDNFPASIFVGQNTAFQTQSIANNNGNILTNNVEYRDVGTSLKVTPQIGNGNIITLTIDQEVSAVVSTTGGGNAGGAQAVSIPVAQTTNKATTVTKVHVPDGYFVVLSGMLRDEKQRARSQMPCIGGIPFLGALVSSVDNRIAKRNYLIFIRPKIVEGETYVEETRRNQDIWEAKNQQPPKWKFEADSALDFLNLPRFNEPNDYRCNPFGSMGPCQSCGSCAGVGYCSSCGQQEGCLECGFSCDCGCD